MTAPVFVSGGLPLAAVVLPCDDDDDGGDGVAFPALPSAGTLRAGEAGELGASGERLSSSMSMTIAIVGGGVSSIFGLLSSMCVGVEKEKE